MKIQSTTREHAYLLNIYVNTDFFLNESNKNAQRVRNTRRDEKSLI